MSLVAKQPGTTNSLAAQTAPAGELVDRLKRLVQRNSRQWKSVIVLEALGLALAAPLAYLWLVFFLDNRLHLPVLGRLLAGLGFLAGVGWSVTHLVRRWRGLQLSEDQVALAIERRTPGKVHNRLINAVQLARAAGGLRPDLSDAVVRENWEHLQQIHLEHAAQVRPALLRLGLAGLLIAVGLGCWLWQPAQFTNAASRILLPLADIDPLYRTTLVVEPGDVEASGDIALKITITGERPATLALYKTAQGKRSAEIIPVDAAGGPVAYTMRDVTQNVDYAVRGNDFTSPTYHIEVPRKATFTRLRVTYQFPAYTGLADKSVESSAGDLEALQGTLARLAFEFDQPLDKAILLVDRPASSRKATAPAELKQIGPREFTGELVLDDVTGYRLEMVQGARPAQRTAPFAVRLLKDQEPKLELTGLERRTEVLVDSVLPLRVAASDDFGLDKVGLFFRRAPQNAKAAEIPGGDLWQELAVWPAHRQTAFKQGFDLAVAALQVAEGEKIELALRAVDTDPLRQGAWTTGPIHELTVGGDGVGLQLQYEQILRTESELKALIRTEQDWRQQVVAWVLKLDGGGALRWDDPKNIDALHAAVKVLSGQQEKIRQTASDVARAMSAQAGNLRVAVGLLADTEIVRLLRILDSVPSRDQPQAKRAALADARVTQERIVRSLEDVLEQYLAFRSDWELGHMVPFTKMLAERQTKMRDQSKRQVGQSASQAEGFLRLSMSRRQGKVQELCKLIQPAFAGLAARLQEQEPAIAQSFAKGAATLAGEPLHTAFRQATDEAKAGRWPETVLQQTALAETLTALHAQLRQAQVEAAQKAIAALKEKAKSDLEAQKELEKLPPGTAEAMVKDFPDGFKVEDLLRIQEVAGKKQGAGKGDEPDFKNAPLYDVDKKSIELDKDSGVRQDPYTLKLGTVAEKTAVLMLPRDKEKNAVKPFIQEKFDDLVGKLLEEADELTKDYQTLNLSTNQNNNDPGEIGKNGGALNSTGAVAATGNKKPPTTDSGGVARTGRQGARAHGMVADDEGVNRRGRDKVLEGQEQVADQKGTIKMQKSDDMQKDTSTGVGGKKVESDDTHFSLADAGKWKDEMTKRMDKPQKKQYIVERQGDRMDPKVAALLRDLTSKQEQVIERLKAIKKELKNLYLPTEHLDELAAALEAHLDGLKDRPEAELFRLQAQTLDKLRGTLRVFQSAGGSFQPSLPRERALRGRVLDEPAGPALPGYEDAVRAYYLKLAEQ